MMRRLAARLGISYLFWLALLAGVAGVLCRTPLFNLLAYEFCFVMALVVSLCALQVGVSTVFRARSLEDAQILGTYPTLHAIARLVARGAIRSVILLVLPLTIISLNAFRVRNCDYTEGLAFFLALPVLSALFASTAGILTGLLFKRRGVAVVAAIGVLLTSLVWTGLRFYLEPPIFAYDAFGGYFPGTLYDEDVALRLPLLWARLFQFSALTALLGFAAQSLDRQELRLRLGAFRWRRGQLLATTLIAALAVALFAFRAPLGFAIDAEYIGRTLGGKLDTENFRIHYNSSLSPDKVRRLAEDHEFRFHQLAELFGGHPGKIHSFVFANSEQKRRLMGAARTYVAKPWRNEIYVQDQGFPHPVLKHELAHVFGRPHGDSVFGISIGWSLKHLLTVPPLGIDLKLYLPTFNVGLIEGLAVAADWRSYGEDTGHQRAAALRRLGLAPPLKSLFGLGFLGQSSGRSYAFAGSFSRYLIDTYGMPKYLQLYGNGGAFAKVYGKTPEVLASTWTNWLEKVNIPAAQLQLAEENYRRPSIFRRVCAHEIANLRGKAWAAGGRGEHTRATDIWQRICGFEPDEPRHGFEHARSLAASGRLDLAILRLKTLLKHRALSRPLKRRVLVLLGDIHWRQNHSRDASHAYEEADHFAAGPGGRRLLQLRRWGLKQGAPLSGFVREYIVQRFGEKRSVAREIHLAHRIQDARPEQHLGDYLVGKQLAGRGECRSALAPLRRASLAPLIGSDFAIESLFALANCQYLRTDLAGSADTYRRLVGRSDLSAGARRRAEDWLSRIAWAYKKAEPRGNLE
jgi:hypothetical protein